MAFDSDSLSCVHANSNAVAEQIMTAPVTSAREDTRLDLFSAVYGDIAV